MLGLLLSLYLTLQVITEILGLEDLAEVGLVLTTEITVVGLAPAVAIPLSVVKDPPTNVLGQTGLWMTADMVVCLMTLMGRMGGPMTI